MYLVPGFIIALLLTMLMLPLLMRFADVLGLVDHPGERKVHLDDIPRSGGLAIVIGFFGAVLVFLPVNGQLLALYAGALVVVIFALLDDRAGLRYEWKFLGQILAVLVLMSGGIVIDHLPFTPVHYSAPWLSYGLTFLFLLGSINAVNLSDGLDGLAAGISLLSLSLLLLLAYQCGNNEVAFLSMAVVGGLIGFLRYNTFPARIFLGDTGSQFVGLMLASLAIMLTQSNSPYSPMLPLLMLGLPILDTLLVMAIRLYHGKSPFAADSNHIHHQIIGLGLFHYEVVALLYLLQIVLVCAAYVLRFQSDALILLFYALLAALVTGCLGVMRWRGARFRAQSKQEPVDRRNHFFRRFEWFYEHSTVLLQWALALFLLQTCFYIDGIEDSYRNFAKWVVAGLLVACILLRKHGRLLASLCTYAASITLVYLVAVAQGESYSHWLVDGYLAAILALLLVSIRMTRKSEFRLDTRDLLVLFLVLAASQLPIAKFSEVPMGPFALRLAILLYVSEYLLNRVDCNYRFLTGTSVLAIGLLAWFG